MLLWLAQLQSTVSGRWNKCVSEGCCLLSRKHRGCPLEKHHQAHSVVSEWVRWWFRQWGLIWVSDISIHFTASVSQGKSAILDPQNSELAEGSIIPFYFFLPLLWFCNTRIIFFWIKLLISSLTQEMFLTLKMILFSHKHGEEST